MRAEYNQWNSVDQEGRGIRGLSWTVLQMEAGRGDAAVVVANHVLLLEARTCLGHIAQPVLNIRRLGTAVWRDLS